MSAQRWHLLAATGAFDVAQRLDVLKQFVAAALNDGA